MSLACGPGIPLPRNVPARLQKDNGQSLYAGSRPDAGMRQSGVTDQPPARAASRTGAAETGPSMAT